MSTCDQLLKSSIVENCNEPLTEGVEKVGVIINRADLDLNRLAINGNTIETLPLKPEAKVFEIYQRNNAFTGTNSAAVVGTYRNSTTHQVNFVIFDNGADVSQHIIDPLFNGEFVILLENKYKGLQKTKKGSSAFQVYGLHTGLKLSAATQEKYSEETGSGWNVTMEETRAPKSGIFLWKTDYTATKSYVDALRATAE